MSLMLKQTIGLCAGQLSGKTWDFVWTALEYDWACGSEGHAWRVDQMLRIWAGWANTERTANDR